MFITATLNGLSFLNGKYIKNIIKTSRRIINLRKPCYATHKYTPNLRNTWFNVKRAT